MELVPKFVILSVLVYHFSCVVNETEDAEGETLEDGLQNGNAGYDGTNRKRLNGYTPFRWRTTKNPFITSRKSTGIMETSEIILLIVGTILITIALIAVLYAIRYWCLKSSRHDRSNVTLHPPPPVSMFSTFPEPSVTLSITNDAMLKESADLPPSYSEVVAKDFHKMSADNSLLQRK